MAEAWVLGWDHHRSAVGLRERLAVADASQSNLLGALCAAPGIKEAVLLSTCNRMECYLAGDGDVEDAAIGCLAEELGVPESEMRSHAFVFHGEAAVRHLFRVVASLESMVLGEYQIQHQVKHAYELARSHASTGKVLDPLFQQAMSVGKQVRNRTAIGTHKLSVASVAVDLARQIHGDLAGTKLLICGAGEMAELAVTHLLEHGVRRVAVVNRSRDRAEQLAVLHRHSEIRLSVHDWSELEHLLPHYDILISSTAAPHVVLPAPIVAAACRRRRHPLMLIDLAVPRDIDPAIVDVDNAYLYNIDSLDHIVVGNRQQRVAEVGDAEELIEQAITLHLRRSDRQSNAVLAAVARAFTAETQAESQRLSKRLGADAASAELVQQAFQRLTNKVRHRLLQLYKHHPDDPEVERLLLRLLVDEDQSM